MQRLDPRFVLLHQLAIQAAIDGQGAALGRSVLVEDDLSAGRLVRPFDLVFPLRFAYYVVQPNPLMQRHTTACR